MYCAMVAGRERFLICEDGPLPELHPLVYKLPSKGQPGSVVFVGELPIFGRHSVVDASLM